MSNIDSGNNSDSDSLAAGGRACVLACLPPFLPPFLHSRSHLFRLSFLHAMPFHASEIRIKQTLSIMYSLISDWHSFRASIHDMT